ncbi:MAG: hypothetical protein PHS82_03680 [Lachnospiraceae bacterium]|nr:hypothetical protein [Lachnospiraceae bacterium]
MKKTDFITKIVQEPSSSRKDTLWYTAGSVTSSAASLILLFVITRITGSDAAGAFSIALAAAQLMLSLGWYNMRAYQVSDLNEKYTFSDYFTTKVLTSSFMLVGGIAYAVLYHYGTYKTLLTLFLCVLMIGDVMADVFAGLFQQKNKLYIGGYSYVVRILLYNIILIVTLFITKNLFIAVSAAILVSAIWLYCFDYHIARQMVPVKINRLSRKQTALFIECFPLFFGAFITSFLINIPKNAINQFMSNTIQTEYNLLFSVSAVVNLFCMFICVPMYNKIALLWNTKQYPKFLKLLIKIVALILCITVVVEIGGYFIGLPILSMLSGLDLNPHKFTFAILLLAGGFNGVITILSYCITVMRQQKLLLIAYVIIAVLIQFIGYDFVRQYGILGASWTYLLTMSCIILSMSGIFIFFYIKIAKSH